MARPRSATHLHDVESFLRNLRAGTVDSRAALISYRVGNEFTGFTDLEIRGTGEARLKSTVTKGLKLLWTAQDLGDAALDDLLATLLRNKVWQIRGLRPHGLPDEPRVELELWYGAEKWSTGFWLFEIRTNRSWTRIRDTIGAIVDDMSDGSVLQIDP